VIAGEEGIMLKANETAMNADLSRTFFNALRQGDFAAIGNLYASDAVILPPGANIIMGRGNIQSYWQQTSGDPENIESEILNVTPLGGDIIREIGRFRTAAKADRSSLMENRGSPKARAEAAKYVFVWQKVGGDWKIIASIWNTIRRPNRAKVAGASEDYAGRGGRISADSAGASGANPTLSSLVNR
jgi:ketosteroid isomerase-like protein